MNGDQLSRRGGILAQAAMPKGFFNDMALINSGLTRLARLSTMQRGKWPITARRRGQIGILVSIADKLPGFRLESGA
jgi:hypothetical protein